MLTNFTLKVDDDQKAALHDEWFRREVEAGLAEAADPTVKTIPHDDVAAEYRTEGNNGRD